MREGRCKDPRLACRMVTCYGTYMETYTDLTEYADAIVAKGAHDARVIGSKKRGSVCTVHDVPRMGLQIEERGEFYSVERLTEDAAYRAHVQKVTAHLRALALR